MACHNNLSAIIIYLDFNMFLYIILLFKFNWSKVKVDILFQKSNHSQNRLQKRIFTMGGREFGRVIHYLHYMHNTN